MAIEIAISNLIKIEIEIEIAIAIFAIGVMPCTKHIATKVCTTTTNILKPEPCLGATLWSYSLELLFGATLWSYSFTVGNRFNEGRQKVLNTIYSIEKLIHIIKHVNAIKMT